MVEVKVNAAMHRGILDVNLLERSGPQTGVKVHLLTQGWGYLKPAG